MTTQEFSDEFDTLVDSYRRFKLFDHKEELDSLDFNEYEKSVFLTIAQDKIVKGLYSDDYGINSFEKTEEIRRQLQSLVDTKKYNASTESENVLTDGKYTHTVFALPNDSLYLVYELVMWNSGNKCIDGIVADVIPTLHDDYVRTRNNPFRGPNKKKALRLDKGETEVELVSAYPIGEYIIRYLKYPLPIILAPLKNETIRNQDLVTECTLSEWLHKDILEMAVQIGILSKLGTISTSKNKDNGL